MDSSSESESGKPPRRDSHENCGRTSGGRSSWNVELDITSASSSSKSQPCNFDSSLRLEMDLFDESHYSSAAMSSYSSSGKHSEDFFQVTPSKGTKTHADVLVLHENIDSDILTSSSSTESATASMVSDITHESMMCTVSPEQSPPPLQVMDRSSGGYDPWRIPSSVFEKSKGLTPVEWSMASNESLFSIHVGNISFSKDRFLTLTGDLQKSKELGKIDESVAMSLPLHDEEAPDSPISQLERNFQDKESAAEVANCVELKQHIPSLHNSQHGRSSFLSRKKNSSCPKPGFRWLSKICCWTSNCACLSCSCPSCSPTCCKCPSFDCQCTCPDCSCSWLTCCFRWPSCCRGCCCGCNCSPCCDWNCCSRGCCSCPSCGCCALSFSCNSCCRCCFTCQKFRHCC